MDNLTWQLYKFASFNHRMYVAHEKWLPVLVACVGCGVDIVITSIIIIVYFSKKKSSIVVQMFCSVLQLLIAL